MDIRYLQWLTIKLHILSLMLIFPEETKHMPYVTTQMDDTHFQLTTRYTTHYQTGNEPETAK
jgi:hypothetical protein